MISSPVSSSQGPAPKGVTVSAPKAKQRKARPASRHQEHNGRSIFLSSSFLRFFSQLFLTYILAETSILWRRLHFLITSSTHGGHGTPKAKGGYPRLYAKQRPGPPGATSERLFFLSLDTSLVLPTFCPLAKDLLSDSSLIAGFRSAHLVRKFSHTSDRFAPQPKASNRVLPKHNVPHAYGSQHLFGTADDQMLGTSLRSLLAFAGNTFGRPSTRLLLGIQDIADSRLFRPARLP
ncbi:hypothetical protein B0T20DRAFT_27392 [Sordaria brevicollis]|uniref:Uncharacterized protein n=1 Tax=Sordaria brevicollis TaxID=83679 RepID=A0AAE0PP76_SORBR|nr:hypothetical protein B0T20DRAFT_27392 [Sordaria brevicollis]